MGQSVKSCQNVHAHGRTSWVQLVALSVPIALPAGTIRSFYLGVSVYVECAHFQTWLR